MDLSHLVPGKTSDVKKRPELGTFYEERTRLYREYVDGCIKLAHRVADALAPQLGQNAKVMSQPVKPDGDQKQISPNGVIRSNGVAVFAYSIELTGDPQPTQPVHFFLSVGRRKGKHDAIEWFVGDSQKSYPVPGGPEGAEGQGPDLEPLFQGIVGKIEDALADEFPTEATARTQIPTQEPPKDAGSKEPPKEQVAEGAGPPNGAGGTNGAGANGTSTTA
jgi:hypothetical protein